MEHAEFLPAIGAVFEQGGSRLRVVAAGDDGHLLLEQWVGDRLNQYIVAYRFFLQDGELHWRGNGSYFPCKYPPPVCDTPIAALCKALNYLRGPQKVYVLVSDTDEGAWASLHSSQDKARAALQKILDLNHGIQVAATQLGLVHLTADAYLDDAIREELAQRDSYYIEGQYVH